MARECLRSAEEDENVSDVKGHGHAISVQFHGISHFDLDWHFLEPSQFGCIF